MLVKPVLLLVLLMLDNLRILLMNLLLMLLDMLLVQVVQGLVVGPLLWMDAILV